MLLGGIVADQQNRRRGVDVRHAGGCIGLTAQRRRKGREVGRAVMIDVVGLQHHTREFRKQISFFVRGARRSDHSDRGASIFFSNFGELFSDQIKGFFPRCRSQLALLANERLRQPIFVIGEIKSIAALNAEEVAVGAALVAVVAANNLHSGIRPAHAQRGLAAIAAMRANRAHVLHLPRARFVAIRAGSERSDRANVDAHAALFAFQMIFFIRSDQRTHAAVLHAESPNVHALAAHAHAAVTQNAARPIEEHHRRPLLLFLVVLRLHEFRFGGAVGKCHVLQFALAAGVAHRAIQRMVAQQHLEHRLARLLDLVAVGSDDHALANHRRARSLQLGHLLNLHQAHAASALQREVGVVAK